MRTKPKSITTDRYFIERKFQHHWHYEAIRSDLDEAKKEIRRLRKESKRNGFGAVYRIKHSVITETIL
jgi:5-bromo-4-chloroindolyl phosphate hydrolysis protein